MRRTCWSRAPVECRCRSRWCSSREPPLQGVPARVSFHAFIERGDSTERGHRPVLPSSRSRFVHRDSGPSVVSSHSPHSSAKSRITRGGSEGRAVCWAAGVSHESGCRAGRGRSHVVSLRVPAARWAPRGRDHWWLKLRAVARIRVRGSSRGRSHRPTAARRGGAGSLGGRGCSSSMPRTRHIQVPPRYSPKVMRSRDPLNEPRIRERPLFRPPRLRDQNWPVRLLDLLDRGPRLARKGHEAYKSHVLGLALHLHVVNAA